MQIAQGNDQVFGTFEPPAGVQGYDAAAGGIGLLNFITNMVRLATVVAGLWVFINIILAGYTYVTSQGDSGAHAKVREKVTMSVLGLVVIVAAYAITAVLSLIFFGDANYILNPTIQTPGGP